MKPTILSLAFMAALYPAYRIFAYSSGLGAVIASVPVIKTIDKLVDHIWGIDLPPVTSRILGFVVVGGLLVVGWYAAEVLIVLGAIAIVGEVIDLVEKIQEANARKERSEVTELRRRFNIGAPQLHITDDSYIEELAHA